MSMQWSLDVAETHVDEHVAEALVLVAEMQEVVDSITPSKLGHLLSL